MFSLFVFVLIIALLAALAWLAFKVAPRAMTFAHDGSRVLYTNTTGSTIVSGTSASVKALVTGTSGMCGIPVADIANGESGWLDVEGVFLLDKTTGQAYVAGTVLYWTGTALSSTSTSTSTRIGRAARSAASAATTAYVRLSPN